MNFEQKVSKSVLNGLDVGDINHSSELYSKFLQSKLQSFFSSRPDHIGCKPPVNFQADKVANVHKTSQFTPVATFVPESSKLLTYMHFGQPLFKNHDDHSVTQSITDVLNSLMDSIFILAFLNILQNLFIFRTNLFKRGILSIRKMQWITTFVKTPVFPGQLKSRQFARKFFLHLTGVRITFFLVNLQRFGYRDEETNNFPDDKTYQQCVFYSSICA